MTLASGHRPFELFGSGGQVTPTRGNLVRWVAQTAGVYGIAAICGAIAFLFVAVVLSLPEQTMDWLQWMLLIYSALSILLTVVRAWRGGPRV